MLWVALPQIDRAPGCKQPRLSREGDAMSFGLYAIGLAIAVGGLICGAHLVLMPAHWIAVGAIVLLEVVILNGVKATRQKDPVECDRMAVYTTNTVSRPWCRMRWRFLLLAGRIAGSACCRICGSRICRMARANGITKIPNS